MCFSSSSKTFSLTLFARSYLVGRGSAFALDRNCPLAEDDLFEVSVQIWEQDQEPSKLTRSCVL